MIKNLVYIGIIGMLSACNSKEEKLHHHHKHPVQKVLEDQRDSSTILMAEELAKLDKELDPRKSTFKNRQRARLFFAQAEKSDLMTKINLKLRGGYELVNAGQNEEAIQILSALLEQVKQMDFADKYKFLYSILGHRVVAYFRLGEIENCINNHNQYSCILPLAEESIHQLRRGSQQAINDILELLKIRQDPNFIYLLNVAYMTLGEYPAKVPSQYRVPLTKEEINHNIPRLVNNASLMGIDDNQLSGGVVIEDFDNDGDLDILASSWALEHDVVYYKNDGEGSFIESSYKAGLKGISGGLNMIHADYNNDGFEDVLILRGAWLAVGQHPNSLLKNNGNGTFTDVTKVSGIYSLNPTQTASWADFNNDGYLDLIIGNESYQGFKGNPCELFLNLGDGTFEEIASEVGANYIDYVKGVATGDYNGDGKIDIFLSVLNNKNRLLKNVSADTKLGFRFVDVASEAGVINPKESFPCWFFDYNNDGHQDLFVASYAVSQYNNLTADYLMELLNRPFKSESSKLFKNLGNGKFEDVTNQIGLNKVCFTMGSSYGDINNDGYEDIYLGTGEPDLKAVLPNRMFLNVNGKSFDEVTTQTGLGHLQKGHGISFADLDNDGDEDIYAVMGGAYEGDYFYNAFFQNPGKKVNYLKVKLQGDKSNRSAIGAKLCLTVKENFQARRIYRWVNCGSSFGNSPRMIHFGLGEAENITKLQIDWPSGLTQEVSDLQISGTYIISEGKKEIKEVIMEPIKFNLNHEHHHH